MKPRILLALAIAGLMSAPASEANARHRHHRHYVGAHHDGRPSAWCGWWLRQRLGVADRRFNLARSWAGFGRPAMGPAPGVIVVWRHHVGQITGPCEGRVCVVTSGNDGHAVRTRPRSVAGAVFRVPG
jgi:hypothetical protein